MNYFRRIEKPINELKYKMQLAVLNLIINKNKRDIESLDNNLEKINNYTQYILKSGKDFEKSYDIEKKIFRFNRNSHFYTIFEKKY